MDFLGWIVKGCTELFIFGFNQKSIRMKKIILPLLFLAAFSGFAQDDKYNETLSKSLGADDYGMRRYVFCILKDGSNTTASVEEKAELLKGHMENIKRLAAAGKLSIAGPFTKNDRNYRGIFIFNTDNLEEARQLVESDPAVRAKLFEAELTGWYASAALMKVNEIHETVAKKKF